MPLIQYVIIRSDLMKVLKWNIGENSLYLKRSSSESDRVFLGAVITQCCHAVAAVNEMTRDSDELTKEYLSPENIDKMHKCVLAIPDETALKNLSKTLDDNSIVHKLWVEQPENIPTCIALKPYDKETVQHYFKDLKLMR